MHIEQFVSFTVELPAVSTGWSVHWASIT